MQCKHFISFSTKLLRLTFYAYSNKMQLEKRLIKNIIRNIENSSFFASLIGLRFILPIKSFSRYLDCISKAKLCKINKWRNNFSTVVGSFEMDHIMVTYVCERYPFFYEKYFYWRVSIPTSFFYWRNLKYFGLFHFIQFEFN